MGVVLDEIRADFVQNNTHLACAHADDCMNSCKRQVSRDECGRIHASSNFLTVTLESVTTEICIYEDDLSDAQTLADVIENVAQTRRIAVNVTIFKHGYDLLRLVEAHEPDLLFLDIDAGEDELDGFSIAQKIRDWSFDLPIVFVTYLREYAVVGYEVEAMHYLLKPVTIQGVEACFERLRRLKERRSKKSAVIFVKSQYKTFQIALDSIRFIEVKGNTVNIHLPGRIIRSNISMTSIEEKVGDALFRCHRSFLVNPRCIEKIDGNNFVLHSGEKVPIRMNGRRGTIARYHDWLASQADGMAALGE